MPNNVFSVYCYSTMLTLVKENLGCIHGPLSRLQGQRKERKININRYPAHPALSKTRQKSTPTRMPVLDEPQHPFGYKGEQNDSSNGGLTNVNNDENVRTLVRQKSKKHYKKTKRDWSLRITGHDYHGRP